MVVWFQFLIWHQWILHSFLSSNNQVFRHGNKPQKSHGRIYKHKILFLLLMVFICPNLPKRLMILKGNLWNDLWRDKKMKGKLHVCRAWACNKWLPKTAEWMGSLRSGFISENCHLLSQSQTRRARLNKSSKRLSCLLIFKEILSGEVCDILIHSSSEILPCSHTSSGFQESSSFENAPPTAYLMTKFSVWKCKCTVAWEIYLGFLFSSLQCHF